MKKYWFLGMLVIAMLALPLLAACGVGDETTTTAAAPSTSATTASPTTANGSGSTDTTAGPPTTVGAPVTLYVGGTFALTGAYAEDSAAILAGFEDYVKWVNENKIVAPWYPDRKIPENITLELLWGDDALAADKTLTIYDELKAKGMLLYRVSGSPEGLALKARLVEDNMGATSQSTSPAYLQPVGNVFLNVPVYTDEMAAIADWFLKNWTDTSRKPRVALLTADAALGRSIDIPELKAYLEQIGYEFVGAEFVPLVPTAAPTTQLAWLKEHKVDLTLGAMVNNGVQPTIKEAVRLGMGPNLDYKITFGFANPAHLQIIVPDMGELADGIVVAGDFCALDADVPGIKFANLLQDTYRPNNRNGNVLYLEAIVEGVTQLEALRLASLAVDPSKLTSQDVLEKGFWQIKDLSTGGIMISNLTYGKGDAQGVDSVRIQQVQNGKIVELGDNPLRNILPAAK